MCYSSCAVMRPKQINKLDINKIGTKGGEVDNIFVCDKVVVC